MRVLEPADVYYRCSSGVTEVVGSELDGIPGPAHRKPGCTEPTNRRPGCGRRLPCISHFGAWVNEVPSSHLALGQEEAVKQPLSVLKSIPSAFENSPRPDRASGINFGGQHNPNQEPAG